jgi:hypothetical protein
LTAAEEAGFELLLTTDRRIRHQQNLRVLRIALVVLTGSTKWSRVRQHADRIAAAVAATMCGSYTEVAIPFEPTPVRPGQPAVILEPGSSGSSVEWSLVAEVARCARVCSHDRSGTGWNGLGPFPHTDRRLCTNSASLPRPAAKGLRMSEGWGAASESEPPEEGGQLNWE